ncbi:MAG: tyrosine--tRNA ligase [Patescibacteria group bacterium]
MKLSEELKWRGFVQDTTLSDLKVLDDKKLSFYVGFDASADSQTVGNLAAMMLDKLFIKHGHKAVLLAGGATSLIGDPGGKDKERPLQDEKTVANNIAKAQEQIERVFAGQEFTLVNNLDWFKGMKLLDFLRDTGKHFSMTPLVQRDYIAKRMGESSGGITYTEFSYTLLQGYDFLKLYRDHGVTLQLAGSDQWGNSLSGVDLVRRVEGKEVHVITMPLIINKSTGVKFGKSEDGAIWLDEQKTSPYKFYQFWLNVDDVSVEDYLKIFTELDKKEIDEIISDFSKDKSGRIAQKRLAEEVTKLVHGEKRANSVKKVTEVLFGDNSKVDQLDQDEISLLSKEIPTIEFGLLSERLIEKELVSSKGEFRRLLESGAISINGQKITEDVKIMEISLIKKGKNTFILAR